MSLATKGALIAALFFVAVALLTLNNNLKVEHDSGIYITLGKSLATGQGYREIFLVGNPPHTKYPPILPLLLEPLVSFLGYHVVAMKLLMIAFAVGTLYPLYILCKDLSDNVIASLVIIATVASPGFLYYSHSVMSEMPYLFLSTLTLYWLHKYAQQEGWSWKSDTIIVALIPIVYLTRLVGLSLVLALVAYLIVDGMGRPGDRLKRAALLGVLAAIPAMIWFLHNWSIGETAGTAYWEGYGDRIFTSQPRRDSLTVLLETNLYKYALHASRVIFFYFPWVSGKLLLVFLAALIFAGFLWCAVKRRTIVEYYVGVYMCGVLCFPGTRPQRYLVPLIPFIWYYFLVAVFRGFSWLQTRFLRSSAPYQRWAIGAAQLLFVAVVISNGVAAVVANTPPQGRESYYHVVGEEGYVDVTQWVNTQTLPESVFIWAKPALRFLWTGQKAFDYPQTNDAQKLLQVIHTQQVDYVVVDAFSELSQRFLRPVVEQYADHFRLVYSNDHSQVYHVSGSKASER